MKIVPALAILPVLAACTPQSPRSDAFTASGRVIAMSGGDGGAANACVTCHGFAGQGDGAETPRLAGLDQGYLHRQLDDYARGRRGHKPMHAIAEALSAEDRAKVSAYYAALPYAGSAAAPSSDPVGRALYLRGDPSRGLPSCASCHGRNGEGLGAGNPSLAGQSAIFIATQLRNWRDGYRYGEALGQMTRVSRLLAPGEVDRVAAYAAGVGAPRPPAGPAASPAARRDDPRSDASAPPPRASGS